MRPITIAILHHHFNRGGVSRVVFSQLSSLAQTIKSGQIKVAIFHGGREDFDPQLLSLIEELKLDLISVPALEYDAQRSDFSADDQLAEVIDRELAERSFDKLNNVLHFHNHSLGKNRALVPAINKLATSGYRMLLQVHDMAEDFRAKNYALLASELPKLDCSIANVLPIADHVHFGVINQRDQTVLKTTGISESSIHYLPNSVSSGGVDEQLPDQKIAKQEFANRNSIDPDVPLLIYPVRGIRRKNLGEAILLTLVSREPVCLGLTLAPANPIEKESFRRWKDLCGELRLPVLFKLGNQEGVSFTDNVAAADAILTTSIAEGFGLVFLESFALGKKLIGRDIPLITADFKQSGIEFKQLYSEIRIPIELINLADFDRQLKRELNQTYADFDTTLDASEYDSFFNQILERGWIDFARLTTDQQREVIIAAARDPRVRTAIQESNVDVTNWISGAASNDQNDSIRHNQSIIKDRYAGTQSGKSLLSIYEQLIGSSVSEVSCNQNPNAVLNYFLEIDNFHPLQVEIPNTESEKRERETFRSIIKKSLKEIAPIPTEVKPKLTPLPGIKAVVFDIYGTLLVSSSGDVGTDPAFADQSQTTDARLDQMLEEHGTDLSSAMSLLKTKIQTEHGELRENGIPFPEIEICSIWKSVLMEIHAARLQNNPNIPELLGINFADLKEISLRAELLTNPVWKMPGFDKCLRGIQDQQLALGIISNAQFYTPSIMEALADKTLTELGFHSQLSHFSFRIGRAKPDPFLYEVAARSLKQIDITPAETLYIGNDVTKDMIPAHQTGFRTGLFAGDKRSLRCGGHGDPHHHPSIDLIFTHLEQITAALRST